MLNGAQIHLLINHSPLILPLVGISVLLSGMALSSLPVQRTGLCLFIAAALCAIPTYFSGHSAEQVVKDYPGINRLLIQDHAQDALFSLVMIEATGMLSVLLLLLSSSRKPISLRVPQLILLLAALGSFVMVAHTAHLGGSIRHEEIRK